MQEIERYKTLHDYDAFLIKTDTGNIDISFQGNLDLYWRYMHDGSILDHPESATIIITKENYTIYEMFARLYNRIMSRKVFGEDEVGLGEAHLWLYDPRNEEALVKGKVIDWRSDDFYYDLASAVKIEPKDEEYHITFTKSKKDYFNGMFITFSVRFRNSGSRYDPCNIAFMLMYNELKNYDPDYHQYHFEEILFQEKKKVLRKED